MILCTSRSLSIAAVCLSITAAYGFDNDSDDVNALPLTLPVAGAVAVNLETQPNTSIFELCSNTSFELNTLRGLGFLADTVPPELLLRMTQNLEAHQVALQEMSTRGEAELRIRVNQPTSYQDEALPPAYEEELPPAYHHNIFDEDSLHHIFFQASELCNALRSESFCGICPIREALISVGYDTTGAHNAALLTMPETRGALRAALGSFYTQQSAENSYYHTEGAVKLELMNYLLSYVLGHLAELNTFR